MLGGEEKVTLTIIYFCTIGIFLLYTHILSNESLKVIYTTVKNKPYIKKNKDIYSYLKFSIKLGK